MASDRKSLIPESVRSWLSKPTTRDVLALFVVSALIQAVWILFTTQITFHYDCLEYYQYAQKLALKESGRALYYRTPGYPLFMVLTGVFAFNTWYLLIFVQGLMGAGTSVLVYGIILEATRRRAIALSAAIMLIITSVPYYYANTIQTESLFLFLIVLGAYMALLFARHGTWEYALYMVLVFFAVLLVKPSGQLMFACFLFTVCLAKFWSRWHKVLAMFLLFVCLTLGWTYVQPMILDRVGPKEFVPAKFGKVSNWSGHCISYHAYMTCRHFVYIYFDKPEQVLIPENGPNTKRFFKELREFVHTRPDGWINMDHRYYGKFRGDPDGLIQNMFENPNLPYHSFMVGALDQQVGPDEADRILWGVFREALDRYPRVSVMFLTHFALYLAYVQRGSGSGGLGSSYSGMSEFASVSGTEFLPQNLREELLHFPIVSLNKGLRKEIDRGGHLALGTGFFVPYIQWSNYLLQWWLRPFLSFVFLVTLPAQLLVCNRGYVLAVFGTVMYLALITTLFSEPVLRYTDPALLFQAPMAVVGLFGLWKLLREQLKVRWPWDILFDPQS